MNEAGAPCPATACLIEDSGEGACYLVTGGEWGLRLAPADGIGLWDLRDVSQWGESYLLLGGAGEDLRFG